MTAGSGIGPWGGEAAAGLRYIYVIAGNYREFMHWCMDNHLSPHDRRVKYIQDFTRLMGVHIEESKGDKVVLYGTYEGRMDWSVMAEELSIRWRD